MPNDDAENENFKLFYDLDKMRVKKKPKGKYTFISHFLGIKLVKSQFNPYSFVRQKDYMYIANLKNTIKIYLSIFNQNTLFPAFERRSGYVDFRDGYRWKEKSQDSSYLQLFISIYADEIGLTNPLGYARNTSKQWNIFGQILNIPKKMRSKLDSIFWLACINSSDLKKYSLNQCLKHVINQIKEVEKPFIVDGYSKPIKVTVCFFAGDAPASNLFAGIFY